LFVSKETNTPVSLVWTLKATDFLTYLNLLAENENSEVESKDNIYNGNEASIDELMKI